MSTGNTLLAAIPELPIPDPTRLEPGAHVVQLYERSGFLVDSLARFVGAALGSGDAAVVIATEAHHRQLDEILGARGLDVERARAESRYITQDASETLAGLMVAGEPDTARCTDLVNATIERAAGGRRRVYVFGEMVNLLWADGKHDAAFRLEDLWNRLARQHGFVLLCGYPLGLFRDASDGAAFEQVCGAHSSVIPAESYTALTDSGDRLRAIGVLQQKAAALEAGIVRQQEIEAALLERNATLRAMIAASPLAIVVADPEGTVRLWNPAAEALFGWTASEVVGRPIPIVPLDKIAEFNARRDAVLRGETLPAIETQRAHRDGSLLDVRVSAAPLADDAGTTRSVILIFEDIRERKRAEETLGRLAAIVESSDDAIVGKSLDGTVTSWNAAAERLFGYAAAEMIGQPITRIFPPDRQDDLTMILGAIREGKRVEHFETERIRKDGKRIHVSLSVSAIRDAAGRIVGASKIARDVTDRKRADAEREQLLRAAESAQAIAEAASRGKDEFLAMLGHELRNPLHALQNAIVTARLDPTRRERALEIARRQGDQLTRLVDDLLDVARITHGRITLRRERISLRDVIERAVENVRSFIDDQGHQLNVSLPAQELEVEADPSRLEQVLANLLTNAAKYTNAGGRIDVLSELDDECAVVRVRDNGIGMSAQVLTRIFDLFAQGDRTLDRSLGGLGIGLTVARRLVELHGGTLVARSEGRGKGSEFVLRIPALPPSSDAVAPGVSAHAAKSRPARVLMVEDNPDAAESLKILLEVLGHRVRVAHDGIAALAAARASVPDVMLVDIGLPGMDGYEVARQVREDTSLAAAVLVALTGYGRGEDRSRALAAGFDHHLVKPVEADALESLIARLQEPDAPPVE